MDWPLRLPVRFATPPAGLKPMAYLVSRRANDRWDVELSYGAVIGDPTSRINGHPARRTSSLDGGASLQVYGVQGLYVEMTAHDKATLRKLGGNLDGLFRSATFHPEAHDWR
ncbi:hypothetical protein [Micromonospora sp. L32]|uniref:hypothetical protein n=1 Tax=Micromonospora sp. L32 TaxID=3452214 RepID=UPI003F8CE3F1